MRRQFILGAALGTALLGVVPITAASAATHSKAQRHSAVLTIGKVGGKAESRSDR